MFNFLPFYKGYPKNTLLILGCQRSGTTLISRVFDNLVFAKVFGEYNCYANPPRGDRPLRLKPRAEVNRGLAIQREPFTVMKPIVDSQITNTLLDEIEHSSALWVYRDFKDVALSNIKKFGDFHGGHAHIEALLKPDHNNWRGQNVSDKTKNIVTKLSVANLSPLEASCLFWYARNILFFEQDLEKREKVWLWKYEQFVQTPKQLMNELMSRLGYPACKDKITANVSGESIGNAKELEISDEIDLLCSELQNKLDNVFYCQIDHVIPITLNL